MSGNVNPLPVMRTKAVHPDKNEERKKLIRLLFIVLLKTEFIMFPQNSVAV